jgi:tRNA pseudouridine65 synthase
MSLAGPQPPAGAAPGLTLLWCDDHIAAFHKPAGLLVHRSPLEPRAVTYALQLARNILGGHVYPVHRLDRPTSGLLLFARSVDAARSLARAFAAGEVQKRYLAVVRGIPPEAGEVDHPLAVEPVRNTHRRDGAVPILQQAVTRFRCLASVELPFTVGRYPSSRYSLVEAGPVTGRRHQIRRHFKHLFHPVIGDTTHGEGRHNRFFRESLGCGRLLLAAMELTLPHPATGEELTLTAPLAPDVYALVTRLGWADALPPQWRPAAPPATETGKATG